MPPPASKPEAHNHGRGLAARRVLLRARAAAADGEPAADEGAEHRAGEAALVRQPGAAGGWLKIPLVEQVVVGPSSNLT